VLLPDGSHARSEAGTRRRFRVQEALCQRALDEEHTIYTSAPKELKPQRPMVIAQETAART